MQAVEGGGERDNAGGMESQMKEDGYSRGCAVAVEDMRL